MERVGFIRALALFMKGKVASEMSSVICVFRDPKINIP